MKLAIRAIEHRFVLWNGEIITRAEQAHRPLSSHYFSHTKISTKLEPQDKLSVTWCMFGFMKCNIFIRYGLVEHSILLAWLNVPSLWLGPAFAMLCPPNSHSYFQAVTHSPSTSWGKLQYSEEVSSKAAPSILWLKGQYLQIPCHSKKYIYNVHVRYDYGFAHPLNNYSSVLPYMPELYPHKCDHIYIYICHTAYTYTLYRTVNAENHCLLITHAVNMLRRNYRQT